MNGNYTFLPELFEVFGQEDTMMFLEVFAGCTITVPTVEQLAKLAKQIEIYIRVEKQPESTRSATVKRLADEYEMTRDKILDIHAKTRAQLTDLNVTVKDLFK